MPGCKVGDIARCLDERNRGKIVHVDAPTTGHFEPTVKAWRVTSLSGPLSARVDRAGNSVWTRSGDLLIWYDYELEPLAEPPLDDAVDHAAPVEEGVTA